MLAHSARAEIERWTSIPRIVYIDPPHRTLVYRSQLYGTVSDIPIAHIKHEHIFPALNISKEIMDELAAAITPDADAAITAATKTLIGAGMWLGTYKMEGLQITRNICTPFGLIAGKVCYDFGADTALIYDYKHCCTSESRLLLTDVPVNIGTLVTMERRITGAENEIKKLRLAMNSTDRAVAQSPDE
jgi:hypothetical protein